MQALQIVTPNIIRGQSYDTMASRLEYVFKNRKDHLVNVDRIGMTDTGEAAFINGSMHHYGLNSWSSGQAASYSNIPHLYFNHLKEKHPYLLQKCFLTAMEDRKAMVLNSGKPDARLFRTLDGNLQALVSPSYFTLDSYEIFQKVEPILKRYDFKIIAMEVTDKRFYLKAVTDRISGEVAKGDVVQFGVTISSSDVGGGCIMIEPFTLRLVCLNGMIGENRYKRTHRSSKQETDSVRELYQSDTLVLEKKAELGKLTDTLNGSLRPEVFQLELDKLKGASQKQITSKCVQSVVNAASSLFSITNKEIKKEIEGNLVTGNQGAGYTMWGLANSFTAAAKADFIDYDTSVELERAAGKIIELNENQWSRIAKAH